MFDYSNTIEPYVISNAIKDSGLDLDTSKVKEKLAIIPISLGILMTYFYYICILISKKIKYVFTVNDIN